MLLKIFMTAALVFSGQAFAEDSSDKGTTYLNTWVVAQDGGYYGSSVQGNIYIGRVDFTASGSYQTLRANVYIPECSGYHPCRRSFSFTLQCRDNYGYTSYVASPYFKNLATYGWEYRDYSFHDYRIQNCAYIDNIWTNWRHGW